MSSSRWPAAGSWPRAWPKKSENPAASSPTRICVGFQKVGTLRPDFFRSMGPSWGSFSEVDEFTAAVAEDDEHEEQAKGEDLRCLRPGRPLAGARGRGPGHRPHGCAEPRGVTRGETVTVQSGGTRARKPVRRPPSARKSERRPVAASASSGRAPCHSSAARPPNRGQRG
jgi:hypothetical protein